MACVRARAARTPTAAGRGDARAPHARGTRAKPEKPGGGEGGHLAAKKSGPPRALNRVAGGVVVEVVEVVEARRGCQGRQSRPPEGTATHAPTLRSDPPVGGWPYGPRWVCSGWPRRPPQTPRNRSFARGRAGRAARSSALCPRRRAPPQTCPGNRRSQGNGRSRRTSSNRNAGPGTRARTSAACPDAMSPGRRACRTA